MEREHIKLSFGGNTDNDTFCRAFGPLLGYVLEVNGVDVTLLHLHTADDYSVGFLVRDWSDDGDEDSVETRYIQWNDIKSVHIY